MKVIGQLEGAQLEQIVGDPTPVSTGRMYLDITNPLAAVPKFHNGTAWQRMAVTSTAFVSQNSGKACTVDWSTGLNQRVVLSDNAIISFSNPQAGLVHTLVVSQAAKNPTPANYLYKLNMADQDPQGKAYQPRTWLPMGESETWTWYYSAGVKAAYASIPQLVTTLNTSFLPAGVPSCVQWAPSNDKIWIGHATSPFGSVAPVYMGREKPFLQPITGNIAWAAASTGVSYSPDGNFACFSSGSTPYLQGRWTHAGLQNGPGEGAIGVNSFADPGTLPTGAGRCVAVHPSSAFVAIGHTTTPFMSAYPVDPKGAFGTKISNPVTLPTAAVCSLAWSPVGDFLAVAQNGATPFLQVYPFTFAGGSGSFGAVCANPATLPNDGPAGGGPDQVAWRPQGDYIAVLSNTLGQYLYLYPFNRATASFGVVLTQNYTFPAKPQSVEWTPDGQYLIFAIGGTTPYFVMLDFSSLAIPATAVAFDTAGGVGQQINDVSISPSGEWLACGLAATPYLGTIMLPNKVRNYLRL